MARRRYRRSRRRGLPPYVRAARTQALIKYGDEYKRTYPYGGYYDRVYKVWAPRRSTLVDPEGNSAKTIDLFGPTYRLASDDQRTNRYRHGYYGKGDYRKRGFFGKVIGVGRAAVSAFRAGRATFRGEGDYSASIVTGKL